MYTQAIGSCQGARAVSESIFHASRLRRTDAFSGVGQPDANAPQLIAANVASRFELRNTRTDKELQPFVGVPSRPGLEVWTA
jgi:hypothetical protein